MQDRSVHDWSDDEIDQLYSAPAQPQQPQASAPATSAKDDWSDDEIDHLIGSSPTRPAEQTHVFDARLGLVRRPSQQPKSAEQDYSHVGDFEAGVASGTHNMKAMWNSFLAATGQAVGSDDLKAYGLKGMQENEAQAETYQRGRASQVEAVDGVGSFVDYAQYTLGSLAPFALESALSAIAGAAIGTSGAPGLGTVAGGIAGFGARKTVKDAVRNYVKGQVRDEAEAIVAKQALAKAGAATGALVGGYPMHVGDAYSETIEAGKPDAGAAFAAAVPMAALDAVVPAGAAGRIMGAGKGGVAARAAKGAVTDAAKEGATELGQEEVLLRLRGHLDENFDTGGEEANSRRLNAGVASMLGGAATGGASGAMSRAEAPAAAPADAGPADLAQLDPFEKAYVDAYPVEEGYAAPAEAAPQEAQRMGLKGVFQRAGRDWNEAPEQEPAPAEPRGLFKIMADKPAAMRAAREQRIAGEVQRSAVPYRPAPAVPVIAAEPAPYDNFVEYRKPEPENRTAELAGRVEQAVTETQNAYGRAARAGKLPEGLRDGRLLRMQFRSELEYMARDLTKGGGVGYIRDEHDRIIGRTPSTNPDWFKSLNEDPDLSMSTEDVKRAVGKALKAERMGVRQARVVGAMLDHVTGRREDYGRKLRADREAVRQAAAEVDRYIAENYGAIDPGWSAAADVGEVFHETDYAPDATYADRMVAEAADDAINAGASFDEVVQIVDSHGAADAMQALRNLNMRLRNEHRKTIGQKAGQPAEAGAATRPEGGGGATESVAGEKADAALETETGGVTASQVDEAAKTAALSPANDLPEPTGKPIVPESQVHGVQASWVIRNRESGEVVMETFDKKKVAALNTEKYEAVPVAEHLAGLSSAPKTPPNQKGGDRAAAKQSEKIHRAPGRADPASDKDVSAKLEDFGEKIGGARKDVWGGFKTAIAADLPDDASRISLAKHFPEPNYTALLESGVDRKALAIIKTMRDEIPAKPRQPHKLRRWADQVKHLREFASEIAAGRFESGDLLDRMKGIPAFHNLTGDVEILHSLGFPTDVDGLRNYRVVGGRYSMLRGVTYPGGVNKYSVELRDPKQRTSAVGGRFFDSRQEAVQYLGEILKKPKAATERKTGLDIYRVTSTGDIVIGKKVAAGKYIDLRPGFERVQDARAYLAENEAALLELLAKKKEIPPERRSVNDPRVGEDYRHGQDVTPERFQGAFGFRGVEFGNWVGGRHRQENLNNAFDALMDLANLLEVPPKALSLNGELALAFGARGAGGKNAASAHYEPGLVVINLTKNSGPGSLAHEWWHALDSYFSRMRGDSDGMITENPRQKHRRGGDKMVPDTSIRVEMLDAFRGVLDAISKTGMGERSAKLDSRRSRDYWSTPAEMSARAFENFIIDKAYNLGVSNDYLANIVPPLDSLFEDGAYPYLEDGEREAVGAAFQSLFDTIQTRETEKGIGFFSKRADDSMAERAPWGNFPDVVRHTDLGGGRAQKAQQAPASLAGGMTVEAVESAIAKRVLQFKNRNITVRVVPDADGLPDSARMLMADRGDEVAPRGYFHPDPDSPTVYLVASGLRSAEEAVQVLEHEAVGHLAVEAMLGADFKPFIERVNWLYKHGDKTVREAARLIAADYGPDWKGLDEHDKGAEIVAKLAEMRLQGSGFSKRARDLWTRIVQAVRQFFEDAGFARTFSENDVAFVLLKADAFLRTERAGAAGRAAGAFSKVPSVHDLIQKAQQPTRGNDSWVDYREVSDIEADIVQEKTGIDVHGYKHSMDEASVRHTIAKHGDEKVERARGNIHVTMDDIERVPWIIATADSVEKGETSESGTETILYKKREGSDVYVVEEVRKRREKLAFKTMYKARIGKSRSRALESQEGPQRTSETLPARGLSSMALGDAAGKMESRSPAPRATSGDGDAQTSETIWAHDGDSVPHTERSLDMVPETLPAHDDDSVPPKGRFSKTVAARQRDLVSDAEAGMPIDRAFRKAFDVAGLVGDDGTFKAPAKAKELAVAIRDAGDGLYQSMPWAHQWVEAAKRGLIDRYGLDSDYLKLDERRHGDERRLLLKAHQFLKDLNIKGVDSHEEARVLHAILIGKEVDRADLKALAQPVREAIDEMGREAVQLGLISEEAYSRNAGSYLHRSYMKHEDQGGIGKWASGIATKRRRKIIGNQLKQRGLSMGITADALGDLSGAKSVEVLRSENGRRRYVRPGADAPADWISEGVFEVRRNDQSEPTSLWRDWSEAERQSMGEILDARYAIAKTYRLMAHDLAVGRFYKSIAANDNWCKAALGEGDTETTRTGRFGGLMDDGDWVQVPDTKIPKSGAKRWGALAGKYVRAEIWRDLNEVEAMNTPGFWQKLMTQWKINKTARNPVVHLNNVMSNLMFMDMADVRMRDLYRALQSMRDQDQDYQEAMEFGAFGSGFVDQELRRKKLDEILAEIKQQATNQRGFWESTLHGRIQVLGKILDKVWGGADIKVGGKVRKIGIKPADQMMLDAYGMEDELYRMACYLRRRGLGDTAEAAAKAARDQFLNYDIRAPLVNIARQTVLPFIGYTYRAVPIIAKSLAARPWKIAKYIVVAEAVNALGYALAPGDEDDERRALREDQQGDTIFGTPRMIRMPWRDGHGDPVFLDVRRWVPAGDVFDTSVGQAAVPIPAPLQWSGPLMLAAELMLNKQGFTGREIVNHKTDSAAGQASKVADWAWKSWMPSAVWVPNSWYWEKVETAIEGGRDLAGRTYSVPLALASSFGLKVQPHNVEQARHWQAVAFEQVERGLNAEARALQRLNERGMVSSSEYQQEIMGVRKKLRLLREERERTLFGD